MFSSLASSCVQGPCAGARMFEMLAAQDMGASFWLVELFHDGGEETKKRLRFERWTHRRSLCTSACETYMMQFLLKKFQVISKPFVCWTARFKRDLCAIGEPNCVIEKWFNMTEFVLDLASCTTGRVYTVWVTQLMRGTQLYKDWTLDTTHFYCPLVTLKWKSDDLFFAWSRKLHDGAHGPRLGAHSVWQPADEKVTTVSNTGHITLLLPLSGVLCLESVMSDKMCVCVCVCIDSFQAGFPNRFLCFLHLSSVFSTYPNADAAKIGVFCSPFACSSCLALKRICCHCHYQHVFLVSLGSVYRHLVKYGFSSGASIRSRTLPWLPYERNPSSMKCSRGQLTLVALCPDTSGIASPRWTGCSRNIPGFPSCCHWQ